MVVEALDVGEHIRLSPRLGSCTFATSALGLERREEALHRGVIPDIARAVHRADDAVISHQSLELLAGVLDSAIRVMQQRTGLAPSPDRHQAIATGRGPPRVNVLRASGTNGSCACYVIGISDKLRAMDIDDPAVTALRRAVEKINNRS
jgi:hypothetical protein